MKKKAAYVLCLSLFLGLLINGCAGPQQQYEVFTGKILEIHDGFIIVDAEDAPGFEKMRVETNTVEDVPEDLAVGQTVEITIETPYIELYPPIADGVKITKVEESP